jgi:hypothetical protein
MTKKRETRRQKRIQKILKKKYRGYLFIFKVHGGPFQKAGLPDLIGCVHGMFFGFEVKEEDGDASELQLETLIDIRAAGGIAGIIEEPEDAIYLVEQAIRLSKRSGALLQRETWIRAFYGTGDREDVDCFGSD